MNLARLLADMDDEPRSRKLAILPEAAIERLKEAAALIAAPNTFKPGDIVTPREGFNIKGSGEPHIVTRVDPDGFNRGQAEFGQSGSSAIANVEVVCFAGGSDNMVVFPLCHWALEPFNPN